MIGAIEIKAKYRRQKSTEACLGLRSLTLLKTLLLPICDTSNMTKFFHFKYESLQNASTSKILFCNIYHPVMSSMLRCSRSSLQLPVLAHLQSDGRRL